MWVVVYSISRERHNYHGMSERNEDSNPKWREVVAVELCVAASVRLDSSETLAVPEVGMGVT